MPTLTIIEVRVRTTSDHGEPWANIAPSKLYLLPHETPTVAVPAIFRGIAGIEEIRWNHPGSLQGHYFNP